MRHTERFRASDERSIRSRSPPSPQLIRVHGASSADGTVAVPIGPHEFAILSLPELRRARCRAARDADSCPGRITHRHKEEGAL